MLSLNEKLARFNFYAYELRVTFHAFASILFVNVNFTYVLR